MEKDDLTYILFLRDEYIDISIVSSEVQELAETEELIKHFTKNCKNRQSYEIYTHVRHMRRLVQSGILDCAQVKRVTSYGDTMDDIQQAKRSFDGTSSKFHFCLTREVVNRMQNVVWCNALKSDSRLDPKIVKENAKEQIYRIEKKQENLATEPSMIGIKHTVGFDARNMDKFDIKFLCLICGLILRDPVQLHCGHRFCKSCAENQIEDIIICQKCNVTTLKQNIRLDKGFKREIQTLNIDCALCNWAGQLKDYEDHLNQCHSDFVCKYCRKIFNSAKHLSNHQRNNCQVPARSCPLTEYGCSHTLPPFQIRHHCLIEQCQFALLKSIQHTSENLSNTQPKNEHETETIQLQVNGRNNSFPSGIRVLDDSVRQLNTNFALVQDLLKSLVQSLSSHKVKIQEQNISLNIIESNQAIIHQDLAILKQKIDDLPFTSYDGTLTWKVSGFRRTIENLRSANPAVICSPPFYTSHGYKMCACMHLYGDGRGSYISLSSALLQGKYDNLLPWPFDCRVSFCLYDQTSQRKHRIDSFELGATSESFRQVQSRRNIASGISRFCPLAIIEQENSPYIQDDTIWIKVWIDFNHLPVELLPYMFSFNPGICTHR